MYINSKCHMYKQTEKLYTLFNHLFAGLVTNLLGGGDAERRIYMLCTKTICRNHAGALAYRCWFNVLVNVTIFKYDVNVIIIIL